MKNSSFQISVNIRKNINYVNYQAERLRKEETKGKTNAFSFLRAVEIENLSEENKRDVWVRFSADPAEFLKIDPIHISFLEKRKKTVITSFNIHLDIESLYCLTEKRIGALKIELIDASEEVLASTEKSISFLPIEESASEDRVDEIVASFVTPNDPLVLETVSRAKDIKKDKYGSSSFEGYLLHDPNKVLEDIDAIYLALQEVGIRYSLPPTSFETSFQRIRLPREVLQGRIGTCIDLSLLFASLLEAIGLRPVLLFYKKHCNLACWLDEEHAFYGSKEENAQTILNDASKGFNYLTVVEATNLTDDKNISFEECVSIAYEELEKSRDFLFAIDINSCRQERILPIPSPKELPDGEVVFDFPSLKSQSYETPAVDLSSRRRLHDEETGRKNRFDHWEDKLLDLNLRNRLISYKSGLNGIEIISSDPEKMLSFLEKNSKVFLVPGIYEKSEGNKTPKILDISPSMVASDVINGYNKNQLLVVNYSNSVEATLKNLARKSATTLEESGCNPLFLTIGLIRWFDNEKAAMHGTGEMYAPIMLLPVKMPRRKNGSYYTLEYSYEDLQLNRTAFEYLKENFDCDFSRLLALKRKEDDTIDLRLIYNEIREVIAPMKNWALIEHSSALSLFNFSHFVMWNDLKSHRSEMMNHPIIASFVYGEKKWRSAENLISPEEMDEKISPTDFAAPLPADSSQIKAIIDAEKGESFILDGPPGTGKSQTIANMIVNFLYHGKKVLFVAEKEVALDVVKRRLDELHLGQFVLELANLGTPKNEILSNYSRLLDLGPISNEDAYLQKGDDLLEKRKRLNSIVSSLHEAGPYFLSPYDAIISYIDKEKYVTPDNIPFKYITELTYQDYKKAIASLHEISRLSKTFGNYFTSPFLSFQKREYSLSYREKAKELLNEVKGKTDKLRLAAYNALFKGGIKSESRQNVEAYLAIITALQSDIPTKKEYYSDEEFLNKQEEILRLAELKKEEIDAKSSLVSFFNEQAFLLNDVDSLLKETEAAIALPFFKKRKALRLLWSRLKPYTRNGKRPKEQELLNYLKLLSAAYNARKSFEEGGAYAKKIISHFSFLSSITATQSVKELKMTFHIASAIAAMDFVNANKEEFISYITEMGEGALFGKANEILRSLYDEFLTLSAQLKDELEIDLSLYGDTSDYFGYIGEKITDALTRIGKLGDWTNLLLSVDEAAKLLPDSFLNSFKNGKIPDKNLADSYVADICFAYLSIVLAEREIATLSHEKTLSAIESYRQDILSFQTASVVETAARISDRFPKEVSSFASSTSAYQLLKLAKNGGRGSSLRRLFHEYRDLISLLTPCFMMSPATLAQYLSPDDYHFDVVIFDEASQIPTSEAIGALYRADSFVIAGDEEQMPPSNYFVSALRGEGDSSSLSSLDEDLESLLDDAIVLRLPRKRLVWHYRSRHESLIAFSNNRFYGNSLLTFPSPTLEKESVSFKLIKGAYEKGRGINRPEAKAIVAEIVRRLKTPALRTKSIGVVTFNEAQQNLVEDMLDKELSANPKLDHAPGGEKIFVKNLENVQGDERDVILFGVTYGPDKNGELSLNFGPLSLKRGERRLNVAVSRARENLIVFSSFEPSAIRAERAKNEGASYLRDFLLFAKDGFASLPNRFENENPITSISVASFLADDLRKIGYSVTENLGNSTFKIDLAVASKEDPDNYILGVLFDNERSAKMSCRDRYVNETNVLQRLSWHLLSLYSVEYLDHKEEVIKTVVNAYNEAVHKKEAGEDDSPKTSSSPLFIPRPHQAPKNVRPYEKMPELKSSRADFCPVEVTFLQDVINTEYPISSSLLNQRIREAYDKERIGSVLKAEIAKLLEQLNPSVENCGSRVFYYPRGYDPLNYHFWRKSDDKVPERKAVDISFIEIGNCAYDILLEQGSMSIDDLAKAVSLAFGYAVLSKTSSDYIKQGIRWNSGRRNGLYIGENNNVSLR